MLYEYIFKQELKGSRVLLMENLGVGRIISINKEGVMDYASGNILFTIVFNKLYMPQMHNLPDSTLKEVVKILKLNGIMTIEEYTNYNLKNNEYVDKLIECCQQENKDRRNQAYIRDFKNTILKRMGI